MLHRKMVVFKMRILMPSVNQIFQISVGWFGFLWIELKKLPHIKERSPLLVGFLGDFCIDGGFYFEGGMIFPWGEYAIKLGGGNYSIHYFLLRSGFNLQIEGGTIFCWGEILLNWGRSLQSPCSSWFFSASRADSETPCEKDPIFDPLTGKQR